MNHISALRFHTEAAILSLGVTINSSSLSGLPLIFDSEMTGSSTSVIEKRETRHRDAERCDFHVDVESWKWMIVVLL
jgi:hypothetical protein